MTHQLKWLQSAKGYSSSLVSYYVPAGSSISQSVQHLEHELATADNIKDRKNSKHVKKALTFAIQSLKTIKQIPARGLALFSGLNWSYV